MPGTTMSRPSHMHRSRTSIVEPHVFMQHWVRWRWHQQLHRSERAALDRCSHVMSIDLDACVSQPCHAQATCTDLAPPSLGRSCSCNTGYGGDGVSVCSGMMCLDHACCVSLAQISTHVSASRAAPTACVLISQCRRYSAHASVRAFTGRLTAASRACRVWCAQLVCR